jgi:hypothetical protein
MLGAWVVKVLVKTPGLAVTSEVAETVGAFTEKDADKTAGLAVALALAEIVGAIVLNVAL